ncbi:MAG: flagellar basal-body rod protein FlgG [Janthinobacterium lividum]
MSNAFHIGATGMLAQQRNVETIANNLVNASTPGYKKARVSFTDMVAGLAAPSGSQPGPDQAAGWDMRLAATPAGISVGMGVGVSVTAVDKQFDMGDLRKTESSMDLAINGAGFLEVSLPDGASGFVRGGTLKINQDGLLATEAGLPLKPGLLIPADARNVQIDAQGQVSVVLADQAAPAAIGQLAFVRFLNPQGLLPQGGNLYRSSELSGEAILGKPGQDGLGLLAQGYIEGSNVRMTDEMIGLVIAQRAYGASARLVQADDELMAMVNNLRK